MSADASDSAKELKHDVTSDVVEVQASASTSTAESSQDMWQPGFWNRFPWLGALALSGAVVLTVIQILVLCLSSGKAVSQWHQKYAPNVLISLLNSGTSVCFAVAVGQGIAIAWWRRAMRGASIGSLHKTWLFGNSIFSVVLNIKSFNIAALAALVTKLTIIDGVLFQRATGTDLRLGPKGRQNITTYPSQWLPNFATLNDAMNDTQILWSDFPADVVNWQASRDGYMYYVEGLYECEGVCSLNVTSPGYMLTCTYKDEYVDFIAASQAQTADNSSNNYAEYTTFQTSFNITLPTDEKNYTWIGMNTTSYWSLDLDVNNKTQSCPATLTHQQCEIRQAVLTYPLWLQYNNFTSKMKGETTFRVDAYLGKLNESDWSLATMDRFDYDLGQIPGFNFEHWVDNATMTRPDIYNHTSDGGIFNVLADRYTSRGYMRTTVNASNTENVSSELGNDGQYAGFMRANAHAVNERHRCIGSTVNPLSDLTLSINMLSYITGQDFYNRPDYDGSDTFWQTQARNVSAFQTRSEIHYDTRFDWMFGALASTLVCVLLVLPVYWGFWELGRKVSLNPIEVANAFQAPVLVEAGAPSAVAEEVVKVAGKRQVVYIPPETEDGPSGHYRIVSR